MTVKWLYDSLKIDKKNTMGIEDSDNDVYMVKNDGFDCVVKGAKEILKKISDYIC